MVTLIDQQVLKASCLRIRKLITLEIAKKGLDIAGSSIHVVGRQDIHHVVPLVCEIELDSVYLVLPVVDYPDQAQVERVDCFDQVVICHYVEANIVDLITLDHVLRLI